MSRTGLARLMMGVFVVLALAMLPAPLPGAESRNFTQFDALIANAGSNQAKEPLIEFSEYHEGCDPAIRSANLDYIKNNQELIGRIRSDLGDSPLTWMLERTVQRLVFVPESRGDYRVLFERYCRDAVGYVLDQTGLEDPYCSIETLDRGKPDMADDGRIKAFLVNNVAKEFISTHLFSNPDERQVKIDVRGRLFIGEIGSFSSELIRDGDGTLRFVSDRYTIWQNNARNPYNALIPPMEETLHIALRHRTEKAVLDRIHAEKLKDFDKIRPIVSQWLAVEEALAGGVVHHLAPSFFAERSASLSEKILDADLETKNRFEKYRYLKAGIALVERLGAKKALKMYNEDPTQIENMLF